MKIYHTTPALAEVSLANRLMQAIACHASAQGDRSPLEPSGQVSAHRHHLYGAGVASGKMHVVQMVDNYSVKRRPPMASERIIKRPSSHFLVA
jgi:hypothetical protein